MKQKSLAIVIPAYNEGPYLESNIDFLVRSLKEIKPSFTWKIMIGENGSTDNTLEVAKRLESKYKNIKARHYNTDSKGATIKKIWLEEKTDYIMFTDADISAHPKYIVELVKELDNGADIAVGNRFLSKENYRSFYREAVSFTYNNILLPLLLPTGVKDTQCGFKAIKNSVAKDIVPKIKDEKYFFDSELLVLAKRKHYKVAQVPIIWKETRPSTLKLAKNIPVFLKNLIKTRYNLIAGKYD